jgi:hypothetical protein
MSFLKKLGKFIVIGAVVGFTGGLALGAVGGLGITTLTGTALLKASTIYGAIYGGLQGAAAAFIKKQRMPTQEVQARSNISVDPQALGKWIFGETAAATDVVYSESVETKQVVHVIAAAAHEIDSYGKLYINNTEAVVSGTDVTGEYGDVLKVYRNLGTTTQDALVIPDSIWPSTARGRGQAHYGLRWDFTTDKGKEKLSGGIPTRITQIVKGAKVYDPRLDTTVGGSGAHRADDQSTWEWSANWALIVANYLLGYKLNGSLIYGVGTDPSEIDWPSVSAMADVCDQVVDGKPRYRIGGIFAITQDHENIIGQLESAIGGKVSKFGGKYYLWAPHNDLVSAGTLTDANIIGEGGIQYTPAGPLEGLYNTARGQYVEPTLLYQLQPYAEVIESTAVTEDGKERLLQQDFPMIQDASIAQRVARELVRRSRFSGTITVVVGPVALTVKPFDVITVNFRETNFTNELFRVISMQYSAGGAVIVELLEEDASIYDTSTALGTALTQLNPAAYDPTQAFAVTGLALTNVSVVGSGGTTIDGVKLSWNLPSPFVAFTEGGFRKVGDTDYINDRTQRAATDAVIAPVQPGTNYEFRVRHVSVDGVAGAYSSATIVTGTTTKVGSAVIDDGSITTAKLAGLAVTAEKVANAAIETAKIAAAAVDAGKIATSAVTTDKLNALAVTAEKVAANAIETAKIADNAVATGKLADLAATEAKIAANAITTTKITDLAISTPKLAAGAVTAEKITALTITAAQIAASTITGAKIAAGTITAGNIAALTITAAEIAASTITGAKIAALTIEAGNIAAATITGGKIAAGTIEAGNIAAGTITATQIAAGTITATQIASSTITATQIAASTITGDKISSTFTTTSNLVLTTAGKLYTAGKTSSASTTAGVFLGHDGGSSYDFAVGDGTKSIVYDGSAGTFVITGVDINTSGQVVATGSTASTGGNAAIVGRSTNNGVFGSIGIASATHTVPAAGGYSESTNVNAVGLLGQTTVLGVAGVEGFGGAFSSGGLGVRSIGNVIVGSGATNTGIYNLIIKEGTIGSKLNDQMQIYGQLSADSKTTFGLVVEQDVEAGTGSFGGLSQLRIHINGVAYKLPLEAY